VFVPADAQPSPEELAGLLAVLTDRVDALKAENAGLRAEAAPPGTQLGEFADPVVEGFDHVEGRA
jgi:hypothetical protein